MAAPTSDAVPGQDRSPVQSSGGLRVIGTGFGRTGTLSLKRALEDLAQGWEPLCGFLDLPVPDHPFPHLNDTAAMRRRIGAVHVGRRALPAVAGMGVALATSGAVRHRRAPR